MMAHGQNTDTRKAGSRQTGTPGTSRKKQQHLWDGDIPEIDLPGADNATHDFPQEFPENRMQS